MRAIDAFLLQLDHAWEHAWESLDAVLEGVTEQEAAWQASCYADVPVEAGWPRPGTIRWHVVHLAHCKRTYAALVRARKATQRPSIPRRAPAATVDADLAELDAAHADQRDAVAACSDTDLDDLVGNRMPLAEFLAMTIRHDAWHAGQIAVARRLYRSRGSSPPTVAP